MLSLYELSIGIVIVCFLEMAALFWLFRRSRKFDKQRDKYPSATRVTRIVDAKLSSEIEEGMKG